MSGAALFKILLASAMLCFLANRAETATPKIQGQTSNHLSLDTKTHNVGLLALRVTNQGFFGGPSGDGRNARWHAYEHLYLSGIWVGAVGADPSPHVSAAERFDFGPLPEWAIHDSYEGQPGGNRLGLLGTAVADDDGDGTIDEDFQNGLDDDGDGQIDEDFEAIGQQMFSSMYRDDAAISPLGLLVKQRSFQWSVTGTNELVGSAFDVINDGETDLTGVYLGFYCDADVGPAAVPSFGTDDLAGWDQIDTTLFNSGPGNPDPCYTAMSISIKTLFTWDAPDDGTTATGGDAPGVFGTVLIGHSTDVTGVQAPQQVDWRTATWISTPKTTLMNDSDRYALLSAGSRPTTNPRSGVAEGSTVLPGDYATLVSVGPFPVLHPGESVTLDLAQVVGNGFAGFRKNAALVHKLAATQYLDIDENPASGIAGKERCLKALEPGEPVIWNNPCDTMATAIEWPSTECLWVDLDCNPCTGILGQETLVPWVGAVAPPYPNSNLDPAYVAGLPPQQTLVVSPAGNGRVILQWDNLGEIWTDPVTGLKAFRGYRIWKVADWTNPSLPDPEDWVQIAQFTNEDEGPNNILTIVNRDVDPIGIAHDGTPIYPVGRYAFVDSTVTNGHTYFYCISSFSRYTTYQGTQEIASLPWTTEDRAVVPCDLCEPVPVRLLSFTAERVGDTAHLSWAIADPGDLTGFRVAREEVGTPGRTRISETLISGGSNFTFVDEHAPTGATLYWLEEMDRDGTSSWLGPANVDARIGPTTFSVMPPAPNPFTTTTSLTYALPETRRVRASIYDLTGRRIRVLVNEEQGPGTITAHWNGETDAGQRAAPGLYILSLEAGGDRVSRQLLLLR
jgi:flagellar hook capping protein FlgD